MSVQNRDAVAVYDCGRAEYPTQPPFHPPQAYPEYRYAERGLDPANHVYPAVREMLYRLGFDREHFGEPGWNPLGELIKPGDNVVVKPNLVISEHSLGLPGIQSSVAHGSVIRPLVDYALIANRGQGWVAIVDSPIKEVDFARIARLIGVADVVDFYADRPGTNVELLDLRDLQVTRDEKMVMVAQQPLEGDPQGYAVIDLGADSLLDEIAEHCDRMRSTAAVYENAIPEAHGPAKHRYSMANTVLMADAFISVAKLKTHRKAGVTLSMKNLVGTTNEKRWLPHHRYGSPSNGGDMFPDEASLPHKIIETLADRFVNNPYGQLGFKTAWPAAHHLYRLYRRVHRLLGGDGSAFSMDFREGDWFGNDTVWRMVFDLNIILHYADKDGVLRDTRQRSYLSFVDGVLAGEREGPLHPSVKPCGVLVAGINPVAVDIVCARLMGFDHERIPNLAQAARMTAPYDIGSTSLDRIDVLTDKPEWERMAASDDFPHFGFIATGGWRGHIELRDDGH